MRGELETLAKQSAASSETQQTINSALEEIDRLGKITESLLVISRLDAGEIRMERTRFDLAALTCATVEQMRLLAEDKNISLTCDSGAAVTIDGNRARLKQVVVNLLDNAIKYTPAGGTVNVSVKSKHRRATLAVADNGPGIDPESLTHIFERFYRGDKARTRKSGGVGLGLSIARSICLAHSGELKVESFPGQGSCFSVELPAIGE